MNMTFINPESGKKPIESLLQIGRELSRFIGSQETFMLQLGEQVQDCAQHAIQLEQQLKDLYGIFQGNEGSGPLQQIRGSVVKAFEDMDSLKQRLENRKNILDEKYILMQDLNLQCGQFDTSSRYFVVLALNMRIQSASIPGGEALFATMVNSTRQLASDIHNVGEDVQNLIQNTLKSSRIAGELLSKQIPLITKTITLGRTQLTETESHLLELEKSISHGSLTLQNKTAVLSSSISALVMSLQFHDRLRQRVEHITQSFENLAHANPDLPLMNSLIGLSRAQIQDEIKMIRKIHGESLDAFTEIRQQLEGIIDLMADRKGNSEKNTLSTLLQELIHVVDHVYEQKTQSNNLEQETNSRLALFQESTSKVEEQLGTILAWKIKSKILSLNAIILAGQLGAPGVGLAVISQEIVRKSEELSTLVEDIQKVASKIHIGTSQQPSAIHAQDSSGDIRGFIRSMLSQMESYQHKAQSGEYKTLLSAVNDSSQSADILDQLLKECERADHNLSQLQKELPQVTNSRPVMMDSIHQLYTMQEERKVYAEYLGIPLIEPTQESGGSGSGDIELF